jgi:hypothetical protein
MTESRERADEMSRLLKELRAVLRASPEPLSADLGPSLLEVQALLGDTVTLYADRVADEAYLAPAVRVEVDGEPWTQVVSLEGSGPVDRRYVVRRRRGGPTSIEFGDGHQGRRPPSGASVRVSYRRSGQSRYASVEMAQGRVILDEDWNAPAHADVCGLYRGVVVDDSDPIKQARLLVQVPDVFGADSRWALPCLPPTSAPPHLPSAGDAVWIAFEACDPDHPVWVGRLPG